jgi:hypothetical protein
MPGVCDRIVPEVIEVEAGHTVRCLLYKSDAAGAEPSEEVMV